MPIRLAGRILTPIHGTYIYPSFLVNEVPVLRATSDTKLGESSFYRPVLLQNWILQWHLREYNISFCTHMIELKAMEVAFFLSTVQTTEINF